VLEQAVGSVRKLPPARPLKMSFDLITGAVSAMLLISKYSW